MKTLLDFINQSESGNISRRGDDPEIPHGSVMPTSVSGFPQDINKIKIPEPLKNKKTDKLSTSTNNSSKIIFKSQTNNIPQTKWTEEEWKVKYYEITNEDPLKLLEKAGESDDRGIVILMDLAKNGVRYDKRRVSDRDKEGEYRLAPGSWYILYRIASAMKGGK